MRAPGPKADLETWLHWLETLSPRDIDLGLDRVTAVLDDLDLRRPGQVITVAGTNGKGSSVALLHAFFRESGKSTGAYTSPHILRYEERLRINDDLATADDIVAAFRAVEAVRDSTPLTYFEYGTLAALWLFAKAGLDIWLLEVGLGGRLDAVNAIDPDGCLITNVSLDHQDWLGDNVEAIAAEKAGVMRTGVPCVFASPDVPKAITDTAERTAAKLYLAGVDYQWRGLGDGQWSWSGRHVELASIETPALAGEHQLANAAGVLALLEAIGEEGLLTPDTVNRAMRRADLAGRQQRLQAHGREWLLDGAHNPAGASALAATLRAARTLRPKERIVLVLGVLADKDAAAIAAELAGSVDHMIATTPPSSRALGATELARHIATATDLHAEVQREPADALARAIALTGKRDLIVVAGSFYTLQTVLQWLDETAADFP